MITIWDIDNCIADDSWRIPYIDWSARDPDARYDPYHALSLADAPGNVDVWASMRTTGAHPVFVTSRPERFRPLTVEWLEQHFGIAVPRLLMRANDDHRPSVEVKRALIDVHFDLRPANVLAAFDDRADIVEMYRSICLDGRVLSIHDVCAYTPRSLK